MARHAGSLNRETAFVLNHWLWNRSILQFSQIKDAEIQAQPKIDAGDQTLYAVAAYVKDIESEHSALLMRKKAYRPDCR